VDSKKKAIGIFIAALVVISTCATFVMAVSVAAKTTPPAGSGTITVSNNIYDLSVENQSGAGGIGTYTVSTGAGFPQPNQDILWDGVNRYPWSSYLTVRSYTSQLDYVTTTDPEGEGIGTSPGFTWYNIDPALVNIDATATSVTTNWVIWGQVDSLDITQVTAVEGTTVADSRVRVTTTVTNTGLNLSRIGIRYEWDLMIDGEDGAWVAARNPDGAWLGAEQEWASPTFERFETTNDPANPILTVFGTVNGPASFTPAPTQPDLLQFANWSGVYSEAFNYTPTGQIIAEDDSAVTYLWGNNETNAIELAPGENVTVTQYLYATPGALQQAPTLTPIGLIALVGVLSAIAALTLVRKRR
jgi:hypothetical protein